MIEGFVNDFDEPIVEIDFKLSGGGLTRIDSVVDTRFNGYISLPTGLIETCKWEFLGTEEYELANGDVAMEKVYLGKVVFDGEEVLVFSLANRSRDALIGTKLLRNRILRVDFKATKVTIEKQDHIPRTQSGKYRFLIQKLPIEIRD